MKKLSKGLKKIPTSRFSRSQITTLANLDKCRFLINKFRNGKFGIIGEGPLITESKKMIDVFTCIKNVQNVVSKAGIS